MPQLFTMYFRLYQLNSSETGTLVQYTSPFLHAILSCVTFSCFPLDIVFYKSQPTNKRVDSPQCAHLTLLFEQIV